MMYFNGVESTIIISIGSNLARFDSNGGSAVDVQVVAANGRAVQSTAPTRDGYTFGGRYSDETFANVFDFDAEVTQDTMVHAKWTSNDQIAAGVVIAAINAIGNVTLSSGNEITNAEEGGEGQVPETAPKGVTAR